MSNLETHEAEQAQITADCENGVCDHAECMEPLTWQEVAEVVYPSGDHVGSNAQRAVRALRCVYPSYDDDTAHTALSDVMCDMRHLCDLMGWSFDELLDTSSYHYKAEVAENDGAAKHGAFKSAVLRDLM